MRTVQTEPFAPLAEPFAPTEGIDPGVVPSETVLAPVDEYGGQWDNTETEAETPVAETDAEASHGQDDVTGTSRLNTYAPTYVKAVLKKRADAERRSMTVVLTEVIRRFLLESENEPRPYIPVEARPAFTGDRVRLGAIIPAPMFREISERAEAEGRDLSTVIVRAILDYVETEVD